MSKWISVEERLPKVNGHAVLGATCIGGTYTCIGAVRFTTEEGNRYKGTDNEGEPVWQLWTPHFSANGTTVIGPDDVTHWMPLPAPPEEQ